MSRKLLAVLAVLLMLLSFPVFANGAGEAKTAAAESGPVVIDL